MNSKSCLKKCNETDKEVFLDANWEDNNSFNVIKMTEDSPETNPKKILLPYQAYLLLLICLLIYQTCWFVKSLKKCWGKFEPGHIFLINIMGDNIFVLTTMFLVHLFQNLLDTNFCVYVFILYVECLRVSSPIAAEFDRALALFWNLLYKERVTNQRAILTVFISKFSITVLQFSYFFLQTNFICPSDRPAINVESNFPIIISLESIYGLVTISSCCYVFHVAKKLQNVVVPINLNPHHMENQESQESYLLKMTKIGVKVNKISIVQFVAIIPLFSAQIYLFVTNDKYQYVIPLTIVGVFCNLFNFIVSPILIYKKLCLSLI